MPHEPSSLARLAESARTLPVPRDYFRGKASGAIVLPDQILAFRRTRAKASPVEEWHHRHVLVVNLGTGGTLEIDGHAIRLEPGRALLIHPYRRHRYVQFDASAVEWLFVTFDQQDAYPEMRDVALPVTDSVTDLLGAFLAEYRAAPSGQPAPAVALRLALLLDRLCRDARMDSKRMADHAPAFVADVLRRALADPERMVTHARLAAEVSLSVRTLRARFAREAGMPLGLAIRRERLRQAKTLLLSTSETVSTIARRCGFGSVYSFSRAFARELGVSPTGLRRRNPPV